MTHNQLSDLYIASCENDGGIYHYKMNCDGKTEFVSFCEMPNPMYMIARKNKMYVLLRAPFENSESGLRIYDIDPCGNLTNPSETVSTQGIVSCHLEVAEDSVYCVNYLSGNVVKLPDTVVTHSGKGVNPERQDMPHTHFVSKSPDAKYIFVTDLGIDKIFVYNKDMTLHSSVEMPKGHGPRHLAFHESGKYVFCANELMSTVSLLEYNDGRLTLKDTASLLPEDFSGKSTAAAIRYHNNKIYVSNRGHDSVSVLDFKGGKMTLEKTVPVYGESPRDFIVNDGMLICTNETSGNVTFVSEESGKLISEIGIKSPLCVLTL